VRGRIVFGFTIFSLHDPVFSIINSMNSSYHLGFDEIRNSIFHAVSLKNIKESGIFQHNQWLKVNLKGTKYPLYGAGAGLAVPGVNGGVPMTSVFEYNSIV